MYAIFIDFVDLGLRVQLVRNIHVFFSNKPFDGINVKDLILWEKRFF